MFKDVPSNEDRINLLVFCDVNDLAEDRLMLALARTGSDRTTDMPVGGTIRTRSLSDLPTPSAAGRTW